MKKSESSERVSATVTPELKAALRALVEQGQFASEADLMREALARLVDPPAAAPSAAPVPVQEPAVGGFIAQVVAVKLYIEVMVLGALLSLLLGRRVEPAALIVDALAALSSRPGTQK